MSNDNDHGGKVFREAWISGVTTHYPGTPKDSYITPWEDTPDRERASAAAVYGQVVDFIERTQNAAARLSPELKGQFVAICWIGQIWRGYRIRSLAISRPGTSCPNGSRRPISEFSRQSSAEWKPSSPPPPYRHIERASPWPERLP
ncbi:hypothetical protein [Nocardia exalbida]|uniref:hypothetical protein n=1 Tax=Nocardia exalbida TaxID=290231 RepID=UPI001FDEB2AF|nr:hypothetical protein [Nocardia exalbida]